MSEFFDNNSLEKVVQVTKKVTDNNDSNLLEKEVSPLEKVVQVVKELTQKKESNKNYRVEECFKVNFYGLDKDDKEKLQFTRDVVFVKDSQGNTYGFFKSTGTSNDFSEDFKDTWFPFFGIQIAESKNEIDYWIVKGVSLNNDLNNIKNILPKNDKFRNEILLLDDCNSNSDNLDSDKLDNRNKLCYKFFRYFPSFETLQISALLNGGFWEYKNIDFLKNLKDAILNYDINYKKLEYTFEPLVLKDFDNINIKFPSDSNVKFEELINEKLITNDKTYYNKGQNYIENNKAFIEYYFNKKKIILDDHKYYEEKSKLNKTELKEEIKKIENQKIEIFVNDNIFLKNRYNSIDFDYLIYNAYKPAFNFENYNYELKPKVNKYLNDKIVVLNFIVKEKQKELEKRVDNKMKDIDKRENDSIKDLEKKDFHNKFKEYLKKVEEEKLVKNRIIKTFTIIINIQDVKNGDKIILEDQELMKKGLNKLKQIYIDNVVIDYPYKHSIIEPIDNKDDCNDPPKKCLHKSNSTDHLLLLINSIRKGKDDINIIFCGYYGDTFVIYKLLDFIQRLNYLFISPNKDGIKYEYIKKIFFSFAGTIFRKDKLFNTVTPSPCNIRLSIKDNTKYLKKDNENDNEEHASNLNLNIKNHRLWMYEAFEKSKYKGEKKYFGNRKYYNDFVKKNGNDVRMDEFYILDYNGNDLFYTNNKKEKLVEMKIKFYNEIYDIDIDSNVQLKETNNPGSILKSSPRFTRKKNPNILNAQANVTRKVKPNSVDVQVESEVKTKPTGGKNRKTRKIKAKKTRKFRVKKPRKRSLR